VSSGEVVCHRVMSALLLVILVAQLLVEVHERRPTVDTGAGRSRMACLLHQTLCALCERLIVWWTYQCLRARHRQSAVMG
jgi:hypothetical protein